MSDNNRSADNVILNQEEHDLLLDHDYDGIEEFNYPLPSWWVWTFVGGGIFAVLYLYFYHIAGAPSLRDEYFAEMKKVNAVIEEQRKLTGNFDMEEYNAWVAANDAQAKANEVFQENCASCHLENGTGDIGPNLTDAYWLNVKQVDHATLYGFVRVGNEDNGMPAWQDLLSKEELFAAITFVMSIKGTNQAGKEPQGEKILE
jgi:cytochrome c oxidase cbb3-type subunit III